jgi:DNA primase
MQWLKKTLITQSIKMSNTVLEPSVRDFLVKTAHKTIFEEEGKDGYEYLKGRGIRDETINDWGLGYCPSHVKNFFFNDRIIIPQRDPYGNLQIVSARKITNEKPTWWNERFEKSKHLFGLDKAKEHINKHNLAIIVEGQFDVVAMHQAGLPMAVGVCGSNFSEYHLALLTRYCNRIVLAFDIDENEAGQTATSKAFAMLRNNDFYIYRWYLPSGTDPDSYVRRVGGKKCSSQIKNVINKVKFKHNKSGLSFKF